MLNVSSVLPFELNDSQKVSVEMCQVYKGCRFSCEVIKTCSLVQCFNNLAF